MLGALLSSPNMHERGQTTVIKAVGLSPSVYIYISRLPYCKILKLYIFSADMYKVNLNIFLRANLLN